MFGILSKNKLLFSVIKYMFGLKIFRILREENKHLTVNT